MEFPHPYNVNSKYIMFNIDALLSLIETYIIQFAHINTATVHTFISTFTNKDVALQQLQLQLPTTQQRIEQLILLMALGVIGMQTVRLLFSLTLLYMALYAYNKAITSIARGLSKQ